MGTLWTPWRLAYIMGDKGGAECVFCTAGAAQDDESVLVVHRGRRSFVVLNRYPYNNGHVMVAPTAHCGELGALDAETRAEIMDLAAVSEGVLKQAYRPEGLNLGINLGRAAGAGIVGHLHFHVVPRWNGDTNYMSVINDVRVVPERLEDSYRRLRPLYARL